jgi:glycosyltransferase involved in cell wall biosynthesis
MKKIKIAHILHSVGGVDVSLRLILQNINDEKYDNFVIHAKDDAKVDYVDKRGFKIRDYKTDIIRNISIFKDLKSIYFTYNIIKKEKPQVIHCHSAKGGFIGKIIGMALNIRVYHTPQAFSYLSTQNKFKRLIFLWIEKSLKGKNIFLLASSHSEYIRAIKEVGFKKEQTKIFNNCINPIKFVKPLSIQKTWPKNYICTVGRPSYQKNIDLMIRVIAEIKKETDIHLVLMGVGHHADELDNIKKLILNLDLSNNVTLLNWTSREDVFNIIKNSKIYISTARYEGLPYSIIESMSLSKPCIVSDCDGNRDLIEDCVNGFIIKDNDINLFKERILELFGDNSLLEKYSKSAYLSFCKNYNIKNNIRDLELIYSKNSL